MLVDAGTYSLKLGVLNAAGRGGALEHPVQARPRSVPPLAVGDLMVADRPPVAGAVHPQVEPRVANGRLLAYTELYADASSAFEQTRVIVEVAEAASAPARASAAAVLGGPPAARRRIVTAEVPVNGLPPGPYVARARVMRGSDEVARVLRPFRIVDPP